MFYNFIQEKSFVEISCNNCGKKILVHNGFVGCAFCSDCQKIRMWTSGTEDFPYEQDW